MSGHADQSFWGKLKRRHVVRVGITYLVVGTAVGGAADTFLPGLGAPGWILPTVLALLVLGLPLALILAWAYEVTPQGIVRDAPEAAVAEPEPEPAAPGTVSVEEGRKSIVVLPFDNMSPDPNDAYFSDGLTEEIITQLCHLRSLRVISRNSSMVLKNTEKDTRTIGRELNVQYVMEGSVRRAGNDLRITAQLIDAGTDEHMWAETYARELEDVFEIQSDIALSVANAMKASLDQSTVERIRTHPTDSLAAHDAFMLGRHHLWAATEEGIRKAGSYLDRALELDPDYAPAHLGRAYWYFWTSGTAFGLLPAAEVIPKAKAEAERAIALDPDLGDAYGILATLEQHLLDRERALELSRLGLDKNPSSSWAWLAYAYALLSFGREECLEAVKRFAELEPLEMLAVLNVAWVHACFGRLDEALEYAKRSVELEADSAFFGRVYLGWVFQARGEDDKAWAEFARLQEHWVALRASKGAWYLAYAFARAERLDDFEETVAHLKRRVSEGTSAWSEVALAYVGLRDYEQALDYVERAADERPPGSNTTSTLGFEPLFAPIRDHPRFQQVLKRLGLQ